MFVIVDSLRPVGPSLILDLSRPFDNPAAFRAGENGHVREPDEQSVLHDTWNVG